MGRNGQKEWYLIDDLFKWTKRMVFILHQQYQHEFSQLPLLIKINGNKLCWRATCQGYL
jgi:hypothetical protein